MSSDCLPHQANELSGALDSMRTAKELMPEMPEVGAKLLEIEAACEEAEKVKAAAAKAEAAAAKAAAPAPSPAQAASAQAAAAPAQAAAAALVAARQAAAAQEDDDDDVDDDDVDALLDDLMDESDNVKPKPKPSSTQPVVASGSSNSSG
jgi:membrane protein involved in colicin uptake